MAKFRMVLKLKSAASPTVASSREDSEQGRIGVAVEEHGSVDQVFDGLLEGRSPRRSFIASAGPKIRVPSWTRPGTATTI